MVVKTFPSTGGHMPTRELVSKVVHDSGVSLKGLVIEISPQHLERATRIGGGGEYTPTEMEVIARYAEMSNSYRQEERR